jgi:hypothetical protein
MTGDLMTTTSFGPGFEISSVKEPEKIGFLTLSIHLKKGAEPVSEKKGVVY